MTIMFAEKHSTCNYQGYGTGTSGNGFTAGANAIGGAFWAYLPQFPTTTSPAIQDGAVVGYYPYAGGANFSATPFYPALYQPQPDDTHCDPYNAQTPHTGGVMNVAMADGSVHSVSLTNDIQYLFTGGPADITFNISWKSALTPAKKILLTAPGQQLDQDVLGNDWPE